MKIPLSWLKSYVELPGKAQKVADLLIYSGTAIEGIETVAGTEVLTAEITTNRPDCLSMLGIAAEVAAVTGKSLKVPAEAKIAIGVKRPILPRIKVVDKKGCPAYTARIFEGVKVGALTAKIARDLEAAGQPLVCNIVDITNFCLLEWGQPLHAFDYDKLRGGVIIVRRAKKGERIVGIDGVEYVLDERILVIADADRPVAIAGVMGGRDTEIGPGTERVLLESARFNPALVRRSSRFLKISTESSYRFERSVDPARVTRASQRASELILKHAGGKAASPLHVAGNTMLKAQPWIRLTQEKLDLYSSKTISLSEAARTLSLLNFKIRKSSKSFYAVRSRRWRPDIAQEADLLEEVIRIRGFEKIPSKIPPTRYAGTTETPAGEYAAVRRIKEYLAGAGFWEAVTLSLVSPADLAKIGGGDGGEPSWARLRNPLSRDLEVLRPSGLLGLLGVLSHNTRRKEKDLKFFEIARRFVSGREENALSVAMTGAFDDNWESKRQSSFYILKGMIENILRLRGVAEFAWSRDDDHPEAFAERLSLSAGTARLGYGGVLKPEIAAKWDLLSPVYFAEISVDELLKLPAVLGRFRELARHPSVRRDIAFLADRSVAVGDLEGVIREAAGPALEKVQLFDQYLGKNIHESKRSLAFSLRYQKPEGTFTEDEIDRLHEGVLAALKSRYSVEPRAA